MSALKLICGNYHETLQKCSKLLRRGECFDYQNGFVVRVIWGSKIEAEVDRLRVQLRDHNVKIQTVIQPLKLQLLFNVNKLLNDIEDKIHRNHEEVSWKLDRLAKLLLGRHVSLAVEGQDLYKANSRNGQLPNIPAEIKTRFQECESNCNYEVPSLPFLIATFHTHFRHATVDVKREANLETGNALEHRFLNLQKCLWVLQKINGCPDYVEGDPSSLWRKYVAELKLKLQEEFKRLNDRTSEPEILYAASFDSVLQLPEDCFLVYPRDETDETSEESSDEDLLDVLLLDFDLPTSENVKHQLKVLKSSASTLRVVDSVTVRSRKLKKTKDYDIDLGRVQLIPLYAAPTAIPDALSVKFRDAAITGRGLTISFKRLQDLAEFQHALTGYYVAFDKRDVSVESYYQRFISGGSSIYERGRMQIWIPKKLERDQRQESNVVVDSTILDRSTRIPLAHTTTTSRDSQSLSQSAAIAVPSRSALPAINRATTFQTEAGLGHMHSKPDKPIIVFYLEPVDTSPLSQGTRVSFLVISIDSRTFINRQPCQCFKPDMNQPDTCLESTLERDGKPLEASRYCTTMDLDSWNVAAPGAWQKDNKSNHKIETNLKWIRVKFKTVKDRQDFAGSFCPCTQGNDTNPTNECSKSHRGEFGTIRLSYRQKLADYNNRHNLPHVVIPD